MIERDLEVTDTALRSSVVFKAVQALRHAKRRRNSCGEQEVLSHDRLIIQRMFMLCLWRGHPGKRLVHLVPRLRMH
ncbi:hypothetical protein [Paracoccus sp. MKU1]|uniref:hypothetical protein n=1 Tax=Paracoccus sp. MKU1 TaxID=1745182 RepID=UPI000719342E|nr:hypothetical protein [Paracoccus sp. MKU1]